MNDLFSKTSYLAVHASMATPQNLLRWSSSYHLLLRPSLVCRGLCAEFAWHFLTSVLQTDTRTEIRILNAYARFDNRFFVWGTAGDLESVFGERLISSYGALPDLHASNHITIILTMTLLPCMALVAMYILINSPELQTKVFPECDPIYPEILVQSLPRSSFKFYVSTYLKCETGAYGWGCWQMLIIFVWCVLFIGGRAKNLWGQHSHVRRRISLLCRSFRTFRPWRWLLGVWTWRAYVCVCVIVFVYICLHICIHTCMSICK